MILEDDENFMAISVIFSLIMWNKWFYSCLFLICYEWQGPQSFMLTTHKFLLT